MTNSDTSPKRNTRNETAQNRQNGTETVQFVCTLFVALLKVQSGRQTHGAAVFPEDD